jgi:hypothetical protein
VRPDVRALAAKAQIDQQHDPGRQWGQSAKTAAPRRCPALPCVARDDAQCAEDGGRGTDGRMVGGLEESVQCTTHSTGQENSEPCETLAEQLTIPATRLAIRWP